MKLLIITVVEGLQQEVTQLLKEANITNFSASDIDGFRNAIPVISSENWFASSTNTTQSHLYFSFTETDKIEKFFSLIEVFNDHLETNNPIRAVVVPIEKYI